LIILPLNSAKEHFIVYAKNKTLILESNRPFFRNKGLKNRKPNWALVDGKLAYPSGLVTLSEAIMKVIEPPKKRT